MISAEEARKNSLKVALQDDDYEKNIYRIEDLINVMSKNGDFDLTIEATKFTTGLKFRIKNTLEKLNFKVDFKDYHKDTDNYSCFLTVSWKNIQPIKEQKLKETILI